MAPSEEFIFLSVQVDTIPQFQLKSRSFSEINERQGGSVWWNQCTHMYKVCSRSFQGHGTWFVVFYSGRARIKLSFHPSQKVLLARVAFLHVLKNGQFSTSVSGFGFYGEKPIEISYHWSSAKKKFENVGQCN